MANQDQSGQHWIQDSTGKYNLRQSEHPVNSDLHQALPALWTDDCAPELPTHFPLGADPAKLYNLPLEFSGYQDSHCPDSLCQSYDASPGMTSGYSLPLQRSGDISEAQSRPEDLLTTWGSPDTNMPSSMSYSSTELNGFSPPGFTPSQYLGNSPAHYENSAALPPDDYSIKEFYLQKVSEGQDQTSPSFPQPTTTSERRNTPTYTATFDARTMNEVTAEQTKNPQKKKSSKVIWKNRNATCEKHKRQKKECNPDKCPGNKTFQRHQRQEEQLRMRRKLLQGSDSRCSHFGDGIETARDHHKEAAPYGDGVGRDDSAADLDPVSYDEPTTLNTENNILVNTSTALLLRNNEGGKAIAQFIDPSETHLEGTAYGKVEPAKEDMRLWKKQPHVYLSKIPRMVPGGISSKELILSGEAEETQMEGYILSGSPNFGYRQTLQRKVDKDLEREDEDDKDNGDSDDGNDGDPNDRSWDRYEEYGDYFKDHDKDWEDGKGPDESFGNNGGGYPKPQGGYYSFSSGCEKPEGFDKLDGIFSKLTIC